MEDILYEAIDRVRGAEIAGIIGTDGMGVEMVVADAEVPYDPEEVEIELAGLASFASLTTARLDIGTLYDLILEADDLTYLVSLIIPGYFAVLGVRSESNLGRARFAVRQMVARLQDEL
jgi:predicted regulator of Ras-like GTPase activity (Roadblock/LC7/MglB family)